MSSIPDKSINAGAGDSASGESYRVWEESLLLPIPTEDPPAASTSAITGTTSSTLCGMIEKTIEVPQASLPGNVTFEVTAIAPTSVETLAERDAFLDELMTLRDSAPKGAKWEVDLSMLKRIPVSILGALREHNTELKACGGGIKVLLGTEQRLEPHVEAMLCRLFDVAFK